MSKYQSIVDNVEHDMEATFEKIGAEMKELKLTEEERIQVWWDVMGEYQTLAEKKIDPVDFAAFYNK